MKFLLNVYLLSLTLYCHAQADTSKNLRASPITDYIVELTDSLKVVQLELPEGLKLMDKQLGLIWGVYDGKREETVQKGYGKCHLIKGNYYYFAIGNNNSGLALKKGDLLYTFMDPVDIYQGFIPKLASHFIRLQNVYEEPFYDRYFVFNKWTKGDEKKIIDSMAMDIKFTGNHFLENNPEMDVIISGGIYKGKSTFKLMANCKSADVFNFFEYIIARPRIYAGREWKLSEIFATWLSEGAPMVKKD
jgi:hypothetical protein